MNIRRCIKKSIMVQYCSVPAAHLIILIQRNNCLPEQLLPGNCMDYQWREQLLPEQLLGHNSACNRLGIYLAQRCLRQHSVLFRTAFSRTASYWTVDSAHIDSTPSRTVLSFDNRCHEQCSAQSLFRTAGWLRVITYSAKIDSVFLDSTHAAWASIVADSADQKTI